MLTEVRQTLHKGHREKVTGRQKINGQIARFSAAVSVHPGDSVLMRESDSTIYRYNDKGKLHDDKWTGPWTVPKIPQRGLNLEVVMDGRQRHGHRLATSANKQCHRRRVDSRHSIDREFSHHTWSADCGRAEHSRTMRTRTSW